MITSPNPIRRVHVEKSSLYTKEHSVPHARLITTLASNQRQHFRPLSLQMMPIILRMTGWFLIFLKQGTMLFNSLTSFDGKQKAVSSF